MQLWMVETQVRGDSSGAPWYLITEQKTPEEAVRFARRWLRRNWGEVMTVREPCAARPLNEFPSWVIHYQRRVWERNDLSRTGNARVTNVSA